MNVDWDFIFMLAAVGAFIVWLYIVTVKTGPGCSGNCQQGRLPCDCDLSKKDQV